MVDRWLGELLDAMDRHGLWDDTMFVLTTDHGHYLGEHGWIGKPDCPFYNTLAQIPLMVHHPGRAMAGKRTSALTSAVDIYATVLEALQAEPTANIHSQSLMPLIKGEADRHRDWVVYGYWGSSINVSDGRYTYFHPCDPSVPAESHSTMMLQMAPWDWFQPPQPHMDAVGGRFLPYTESPVWKYTLPSQWRHDQPMLFDVEGDPLQLNDLAASNPDEVQRMQALLKDALKSLEAPESQFARLHLDS
jgi:arylsulfatase A-like enzyme